MSVLFRGPRHILPHFSICTQHPRGGQSPRSQIKDHNHTFKGKELATKLGSSAEVNGCRGRREFQLTDSKSAGELRMAGRMLSNQPLSHWFVFKQCWERRGERFRLSSLALKHTSRRAEEILSVSLLLSLATGKSASMIYGTKRTNWHLQ